MPKMNAISGPVGKYLVFRCPGCRAIHQVTIESQRPGPVWSFNGDLEHPTISPSILVRWEGRNPYKDVPISKVCHSFVREGMIQFLGDCTHDLAGQTVAMQETEQLEEVLQCSTANNSAN